MKSGILARFGSENKDVITEATAQEFRDWLAIKGLNIGFMSDDTLNGLFMGRYQLIIFPDVKLHDYLPP